MGGAIGSRPMLQEATYTMKYGLKSMGSMTAYSPAGTLLCLLHQGLCSLCSIVLGHLYDSFLYMYKGNTYYYAWDRLPVEL